MTTESQAARLHRIYDDENCPRCGKHIRCIDLGADGVGGREFVFDCPSCHGWWTPIELKRRAC